MAASGCGGGGGSWWLAAVVFLFSGSFLSGPGHTHRKRRVVGNSSRRLKTVLERLIRDALGGLSPNSPRRWTGVADDRVEASIDPAGVQICADFVVLCDRRPLTVCW